MMKQKIHARIWRTGRLPAGVAVLLLAAACGKTDRADPDPGTPESEPAEILPADDSGRGLSTAYYTAMDSEMDELPPEWGDAGREEEQAWLGANAGGWEDGFPEEEDPLEDEVFYEEVVPEPELTTPLEPEAFLNALYAALDEGMDPVDVEDILARVPADPALLDRLKGILDDPDADPALQRYAATALVHAGTGDSLQFVLDELLQAVQSGNDDRSDQMVSALESPTTPEGVDVLFDFLLGEGAYSRLGDRMQPEAQQAARQALLDAADGQAVGDRATELYREALASGNTAQAEELLDGMAHPYMLTRLAVSAYAEGQPAEAVQFTSRLVESDDQNVVHAVVQLSGDEAMPVEAAAAILYEWGQAHPDEAMPGLFMEYLSDSTQPAAWRGIAAYGLVGTTDPEEARQALEKILGYEEDPAVRADIEAALALLAEDQTPVE